MTAHVDPRFGATLRQLREQAGLSLRALAQLTHRGKSHLHELENGSKAATFETARHLDQTLNAGGRLARLVAAPVDHEAEADDLLQRASASDVSAETLARIEQGVDELAIRYPTTAPADLLPLVRRHLGHVTRLHLTPTRLVAASAHQQIRTSLG